MVKEIKQIMRTYFVILILLIANICGNAQNAMKGFVQKSGMSFLIDGKEYHYIGANYWYGALLDSSNMNKQRIKEELSFLASNGVKNLRILVGAEGLGLINGMLRVSPSLQPAKGVFDENVLKNLDYLLAEMGKLNMKGVLYLSNNWEWSGGFLQYLNWNGLLPDSVMHAKMKWEEQKVYVSKFYDCDACKEDYKMQVKIVINRVNTYTHTKYINDSAIMAWELGNEPRPMLPSATFSFTKWIREIAGLIRSIDKKHLITIGSEGFAGTENMQLFEDIHADNNIDYLTIHIWPKNWGYFQDTAISKSWSNIINNTKAYIDKHIAVAKKLNKPLVLEEFGLPRDNLSYDPSATVTLRDAYYRFLFNECKNNSAIAGCNFWAFGGKARPKIGQLFWKDGDDWLGDPPNEEQGLNTVFDTDKSTWNIINFFTKSRKQ